MRGVSWSGGKLRFLWRLGQLYTVPPLGGAERIGPESGGKNIEGGTIRGIIRTCMIGDYHIIFTATRLPFEPLHSRD